MTLHYPFPIIEGIGDVLPHIDDNFRVVEKNGLTFVNYNMMGNEVFPYIHRPEVINSDLNHVAHRAAVRRECRGITFDATTGDIVSRPFHKFFNAGEREDVSLSAINVKRPHVLLEKLDGSMIRPLRTASGGIRWGTKMGITDTALLAEEFAADKPQYYDLAEFYMSRGMTPLFEFCSRRNRIVVDFPEETMVLLAVRDNVSGVYLPRWQLRADAGVVGVPVVENVDTYAMAVPAEEQGVEAVHDLDAVMYTIKGSGEGEGKIIFFDDGHAVKVKNDWYVRIHRAKDMMRSEMRLLALFLNDELDDLMASIDPADQIRIETYIARFNSAVHGLADLIEVRYGKARTAFETKKDFALSDMAKGMSPAWKSVIFAMWDGKYGGVDEAALTLIKNGMTSETKFALMKEVLGIETGWEELWARNMEDVV